MDSVFFDRSKLGVSGHYFIPNTGAYVELRGQKNYASRLDTCQRASIFFYNRGTTTLSVRVNRGEATTETFEPIDDLQEMTVRGKYRFCPLDGGKCGLHLVLWPCHGRYFRHCAG